MTWVSHSTPDPGLHVRLTLARHPLKGDLHRAVIFVAAQLEVDMRPRGAVKGTGRAVFTRYEPQPVEEFRALTVAGLASWEQVHIHASTLAWMCHIGAVHDEGAVFEAVVWYVRLYHCADLWG